MPTCVGCSQEIPTTASYCPRCGTPNPEAATLPTPAVGRATTEQIPPDELKQRLQAALGRDFEVAGVVGEGGFAVVFVVQDRKLARRIAVKVLRPELTASHATIQRFAREAEAAASLTHPHILAIHFVGEGAGLVYFGMPLVEGEPLEARMAREGQLPEADAVRIGAEIADALSEAHAHGLVHRDVKPANVLLQGGKQRVLVTDFGIAKAVASKADRLTGTGVIIGSPHYMSPEQASGSSEIDARSDIYSLGVVLWQMLAGALPFEGPDSQAVLVQHITKPLPSLRGRRRDVQPALARVIERCCAKRPADRFQSAADVAAALRGAGEGGPNRALPRWAAPTGLAAVLLIVAAAAWWLGWRRSPPAARTAAPSQPATAHTSAPMVAVLPFGVTNPADTQLARQAAYDLATTLKERFGVGAIDFNELFGRWTEEKRSLSVIPDSNAAFAASLGANQLVIGNVFEVGRQVRVGLDVYDTRTYVQLGHYDRDGSPDSVISLLDQLAGSVAVAFCKQPEFNPQHICFESPPRSIDSVRARFEGAIPATPPVFEVLVSSDGSLSDVRPPDGVPPDVVTAALPALRSARYVAARKGGTAVAAWARVPVLLAAAPVIGTSAAPSREACDHNPTISLSNPNRGCFEIRPNPLSAPALRPPRSCARTAGAVVVLVHVSEKGVVLGTPLVTRRSPCTAFDQAAAVFAGDLPFQPASKNGVAVSAWTQLLVRPIQ
jgi:TolB-like protein